MPTTEQANAHLIAATRSYLDGLLTPRELYGTLARYATIVGSDEHPLSGSLWPALSEWDDGGTDERLRMAVEAAWREHL